MCHRISPLQCGVDNQSPATSYGLYVGFVVHNTIQSSNSAWTQSRNMLLHIAVKMSNLSCLSQICLGICRVCGDDLIYWTKTLQLSFSSLFGVENWRGWLRRRNDLLLSTIRCQRLLPLSGGPPDRLRAVIISATYTEQASIKFDGFSLFASATLNLSEIFVNIFCL